MNRVNELMAHCKIGRWTPGKSSPCLLIGKFDGVHRGHQAIVAEARAYTDSPLWVLTFSPSPEEVLGGLAAPPLTTPARRAQLLAQRGVSQVYVQPFDRDFAKWSPQQFAQDLLANTLHVAHVVVGGNFRFGAERTGDLSLLRSLGEMHGFRVHVTELQGDAQGVFSSTRVRQALATGDIAGATSTLGRFPAFEGVVVSGRQTGTQLGFKTANLDRIEELLPCNGVYAVVVDEQQDGKEKALGRGVMNIGVRPTFGGGQTRHVEVHMLDFDRKLYGSILRIHLVARLREERRFESLDALRTQLAHDAFHSRIHTETLLPRGGSFARTDPLLCSTERE